jgi:DNA-binding transcriptional LysR family regulator
MNWEERVGRRLTLRDLRILLTTVEVGSMSKAAAILRVSQPAISKTIKQIERVVGVALVQRTSRGIEPTEHGRSLLTHSHAVFRELKAGIQAMDDLAHPKEGELRLAGNQVALAGIIATVIKRLHPRYPGVVFNVVPAYTYAEQIQLLEQERVELVLGRLALPLAADHLRVIELFQDSFVIVAGPNNPWKRRKEVELRELLNEPWAFPALDTVSGRYIEQIFRSFGLDLPRITVVGSSIQLHQRLVLENGFLTLFPHSLVASVPGMQILPVSLPAENRSIGILTLKHRTLSPLAKLFVEEAELVAADWKEAEPEHDREERKPAFRKDDAPPNARNSNRLNLK